MTGFRESARFLISAYDGVLAALPTVFADAVRAVIVPLPDHASFVHSLRFVVVGPLTVLVIRYRPGGPRQVPRGGRDRGEEQ